VGAGDDIRGTRTQMLTEKKEADVVQIVNTSIIPRLEELELAKDYNSERLQKHYRNDTEVPSLISRNSTSNRREIRRSTMSDCPASDSKSGPSANIASRHSPRISSDTSRAPNDIDKLPT